MKVSKTPVHPPNSKQHAVGCCLNLSIFSPYPLLAPGSTASSSFVLITARISGDDDMP
jgi:hypothetical protein